MRLCFATHNAHKLREIQQMLPTAWELIGLEALGCYEDLPEEQDSIEGNALQKAQYLWDKYQVNCFADDSGLEVEALEGAPGVYSARYAGPQKSDADNLALLLKNMQGQPNRKARFKTCISLVLQGEARSFVGIAEGQIIEQPRGSGGFGYDPVFVPTGHTRTFAEMSAAEKNAISHRAKAFAQLTDFLQQTSL